MKWAVWFAGVLGIAATLLASPPHGKAETGTAPILKIESVSPKGTGTRHYSAELRMSASAFVPLVLRTDPGGKLIPIPGPQYRIDDTHVLLLGWSSYGGGMQTIHALLVQLENGNVTLQRELMLTAARTALALIVRRDGPDEIRLGLGEPAARMLSERDWLLVFGPDSDQRLDIAAIRKLRFAADAKREADALYAPPYGSAPFPSRVAWFSVSAGGFAPMAGGR